MASVSAHAGEGLGRASAGVLDRGFLVVGGKDHVRFLQGMLTNDVAGLTPGQACPALLLSQKGRVVADLVALRFDDHVLLSCEGPAEPVRDALERFVIMDDVTLEIAALAELAVIGQRAQEVLTANQLPAPGPWRHQARGSVLVLHAALADVDAYRVISEHDSVLQGCGKLEPSDISLLFLEAAWPRIVTDFAPDEILPMEAGCWTRAISFSKGCYVGQEVVVRGTTRGGVKHRFVGLRVSGRAVPPRGAKVASAARPEAGHVTSARQSPDAGVLALAYLWHDVASAGTSVEVQTPDGALAAVVVAGPFDAPKERS